MKKQWLNGNETFLLEVGDVIRCHRLEAKRTIDGTTDILCRRDMSGEQERVMTLGSPTPERTFMGEHAVHLSGLHVGSYQYMRICDTGELAFRVESIRNSNGFDALYVFQRID